MNLPIILITAADFLNQYDVRMIALDALKHSDDSTSDVLLYRADVIANKSACWVGNTELCMLFRRKFIK